MVYDQNARFFAEQEARSGDPRLIPDPTASIRGSTQKEVQGRQVHRELAPITRYVTIHYF